MTREEKHEQVGAVEFRVGKEPVEFPAHVLVGDAAPARLVGEEPHGSRLEIELLQERLVDGPGIARRVPELAVFLVVLRPDHERPPLGSHKRLLLREEGGEPKQEH